MRVHFISLLITVFLTSSVLNSQVDNYYLVKGNNFYKQGNIQLALDNYNVHIDNYPEDPMGYVCRAKLYSTMRRGQESRLDIKIAQRLNPLSLMVIDPALRSKNSAKKLYDFNYNNLDAAFVKSPTKYEVYQKVLEQLKFNHSQDSLIILAIKKLNDLKIEEAIDILDHIQMNDQNKYIVFDLYGKVYLKTNELSTAKEYFNKSIDANPLFPIAYHNRSICHKLLGEYELAQEDLKKAISLNDEVSLFYFTQAKLNEKVNNPEAARTSYELALSKDDNYHKALINYSQLFKGLGEYKLGVKYLNQAIAGERDEFESDFLTANLNFIYGEYEEAILGYSKYLKSHPDDSSVLFNLGLSKILLRNDVDGCSDLALSIELDESEHHQTIYDLFCSQGGGYLNF